MRCAAITRAGERCRLDATVGSYCYQHSPETAEERRRNARRGGLKGGNGRPQRSSAEIREAKSWIRGLISKMLRGEVERELATACFMGLNVLARYIELERKIKETEELEERVAELEAAEAEERNQTTNGRSQTGGRWR